MKNRRPDGLSFESAAATVTSICRPYGVQIEYMGPSIRKVTGLVTPQAMNDLRTCLGDRHGFGVTIVYGDDDAWLEIDLAACPEDTSYEERRELVQTEADAAERRRLRKREDAGERPSCLPLRVSTEWQRHWSWGMQQTIVFLRSRAAFPQASGTAPTVANFN